MARAQQSRLPTVPWWRGTWSGRDKRAALLLLLGVFLAYLPLWHAGYVWDDDVLITANPCVIGPLGLKEIWTTRAADICPLTITTFWLEHKLWGLSPLPYHLVNVLMHAGGALLLWRVLLALRVPGAWLGAALWALHPVQVESVAWITEMKNTQSGIFYLLAVLFFLRSLRGRETAGDAQPGRPDAPTILCAALALASKSSTVVLPVVLCLLAWWLEGRWRWRRAVDLWPIFLLSVAAGLLSIWTQLLQPPPEAAFHLARSWPQRLATGADAVWFYLGKLLWPHPLMAVYPRWETDPGRWFSFLPLLALVAIGLVCWRQRRAWGSGPLLAGGYFLAALAPVLGLAEISFFSYSFVADHFVYLASMGPLALAGAGLVRLADDFFPAAGGWRWAPSGALLLALGVASWSQARLYKNQETLWTDELAKNPRCWVAHGNLGLADAGAGRLNAAIAQYHEALALGPDDAKTHNNLGDVFLRQGRVDDAVSEYQEAVKLAPGSGGNHYNLGNVFLQVGRVDDAIAQFRSAATLNAGSLLAHSNLGAALKLKGQTDEAIAQYEIAVRIAPDNVQDRNNLGNLYFQKGQVDKATGEYQEAVRANPNDPYTYRNLGNVLAQRGHLTEAIGEYQEALKLDPADAETHNNLGNALLQKGQMDAAFAQYQEAVKAGPGYAAGHRNLGLVLARKGRFDEAIAQFKEAVRLKPDFTEAQHDLATVQGLDRQAAGAK